jgi:DNA segregation ATPase FtsK/SpoIIIE, S-DNA-T family
MTMTDDLLGLGWVPAPGAGSAARKAWPRTARVVWWLARRPLIPLTFVAMVALGVRLGPVAAAVAVIAVTAGLSVWEHAHRSSFDATVGRVLRGTWRSAWTYGLRWRASMMFAGLGGRFDGNEWLPRVVRVRAGRYVDRVTVRMVVGQQPADWERRSDALAHAFGARSCQVQLIPGRPGYLTLSLGREDRLLRVVEPLPIPETVDLDAVPVGATENGEPWCLAVSGGAHTLLAGATGSGKGSVLQSLLRGLAPGIRAGLVQVWAVDPKGGMEMAFGAPLFTHFAYQPHDMVELLELAAWTMKDRARRFRGVVRVHTPTPEEPAIVVLVDELADLTSYEPDPQLRRRTNAAMSLLLSQGRGPAVTVIAAMQDPRKEQVSFRDLFPVRVALRMVEVDQTDLVLGKGARNRGAACELIPRALAGVGYQLLDGEQHPTRVRASWISDDDIHDLARDYPAPHPVTLDHDVPVVIDLTDKTPDREGRES